MVKLEHKVRKNEQFVHRLSIFNLFLAIIVIVGFVITTVILYNNIIKGYVNLDELVVDNATIKNKLTVGETIISPLKNKIKSKLNKIVTNPIFVVNGNSLYNGDSEVTGSSFFIGNTTLQNIFVDGEINSDTIIVRDGITIGNNLLVNGNALINNLNVTNNTNINILNVNNINVPGDLTVLGDSNLNNLIVSNSTTINTLIANQLNINQNAIILGNTTINGVLTTSFINTSVIVVQGPPGIFTGNFSGNTAFLGSNVFDGICTFNSLSTFNSNTDFNGVNNFDGICTFGALSTFNSNTDFNGVNNFDGTCTFGALSTFNSNTDFNGINNFDGTCTFTALSKFDSTTDFNGVNTFDGVTTFNAAVTHTVDITMQNSNIQFGDGITSNLFVLDYNTAEAELRFNIILTQILSLSSTLAEFGIGITLPTTGGTPSSLNYYEKTSISTTFSNSGGSSNIFAGSNTLNIIRIGNLVTIDFPTLATPATTTIGFIITDTAVATRFRPNQGVHFLQRVAKQTGTIQTGLFLMQTNGVLLMFADVVGGNFGITGGYGPFSGAIHYIIS